MPDSSAPVSIDAALSLMKTAPATAGTADWKPSSDVPSPELPPEKKDTPAAENAADTKPAADTPPAAETPPAQPGADTPPAQSDAPAAKDGQADQGSLPPIEPPSSWTAEEKDAFKTSPRKAQEAIVRREQDRDRALRDSQNATAEQRKAVDAEVIRLKGLADKITSTIKDEVAELARDFPDIKSQADVEALAASDATRFSQFQARLMRFNAARQAEAEAQQVLQAKAQEQHREVMKTAHEALVKTFPTWSDPKIATKEITELQDYAVTQGASEQGARATHDPVVYKLAQKAMLYDRAQAALAAAANKAPAPAIAPGTTSATPKADKASADRAGALQKLDKSGDIEDAVALMLK